jgi:hypothetical protein
MANINVAGLIEDADQAIQQRTEAAGKVAALRELLRYSVKAKEATKEQAAWIEDTFPIRERKSAEERVAELEERLATANAKLGDGE